MLALSLPSSLNEETVDLIKSKLLLYEFDSEDIAQLVNAYFMQKERYTERKRYFSFRLPQFAYPKEE